MNIVLSRKMIVVAAASLALSFGSIALPNIANARGGGHGGGGHGGGGHGGGGHGGGGHGGGHGFGGHGGGLLRRRSRVRGAAASEGAASAVEDSVMVTATIAGRSGARQACAGSDPTATSDCSAAAAIFVVDRSGNPKPMALREYDRPWSAWFRVRLRRPGMTSKGACHCGKSEAEIRDLSLFGSVIDRRAQWVPGSPAAPRNDEQGRVSFLMERSGDPGSIALRQYVRP